MSTIVNMLVANACVNVIPLLIFCCFFSSSAHFFLRKSPKRLPAPWTPRTRTPIFFLLRTEDRFFFFCFFTEPLSFRAHFSTFFSMVLSTHSRGSFYLILLCHWQRRRRRRGDVRAVGPRDELEERVGRVVLFGERFPRRAESPVARDEGLARGDGLALVPRVLRVLQRDGLVDRVALRARGGEHARAERVLERSVHKVDGDGLVEVRALAHDEVRRDGVRDVHVLRREPRLRFDEHGVAVEEVELVEGAHDELDGVLLGERARVGRADARGAPPRDLEPRVDARDGEREVLDADVEGHHEHFFCELLGGKKRKEKMGMFGSDADAVVQRLVGPSIGPSPVPGESTTEFVSKAMRAAEQAIIAVDSAIKASHELAAGIIESTCHPDDLKHGARRGMFKRPEAYRENPDKSEANKKATEFLAEFYGTQAKRAAQYKRWERLDKYTRDTTKRPDGPASMVHGDQVVNFLFTNPAARDFANSLGIGPESTDRELKQTRQDPEIRHLIERASFGTLTNEFVPEPQEESYDAYPYDNGMYTQSANGELDFYQGGFDYAPQIPDAPRQSLAQKVRAFFSAARKSTVGKLIVAAAGTFLLYMLMCLTITWLFEGKWRFCSLYDTVMGGCFSVAWKQQISKEQTKRILVDNFKESALYKDIAQKAHDKQGNVRPEDPATLIGNFEKLLTDENLEKFRESITNTVSDDTNLQKNGANLFKTMAESDFIIDSIIGKDIATRVSIKAETAKTGAPAFMKKELLLSRIRSNDALIHHLSPSMQQIAENPFAMAGLYTSIVMSMFFLCMGARKRFWISPVAVVLITTAVGYSNIGIGKQAADTAEAAKTMFFTRDGVGASLALYFVQAALAGMVYLVSGAPAGEAFRHATSVMASGAQADALAEQQRMQMRNQMRSKYYNSMPMLAMNHMRDMMGY